MDRQGHRRAGRGFLFDSVGKLLEVQPVTDGTKQLGYPPDIVFNLGVTLLPCVLAYLVPRTSVLGVGRAVTAEKTTSGG